jgi:Transposase DDE domain group 1
VIGQHCARLQGRARRITIDVDPTDDPTHGQQEFAFFNGHYDSWCYLPLLGFVTFNDEAEQYLLFALLRPGTSPAKLGLRGRLRTLFGKLRAAFPGARLRVRLDGGFAGEDVLSFLEAEGVEYVVALGGNRRLDKRARRLMGRARMLSKATGRRRTCSGKRATRPRSGGASGGSSSRPKWCGIPGGLPRTIPGSW